MLCWKILYSKCYAGAVHAVLEEICSCCVERYCKVRCYGGAIHAVLEECCSCSIGRYCTVGAMIELFMLCWIRADHIVLEDTVL
jgi:hypothetical protein